MDNQDEEMLNMKSNIHRQLKSIKKFICCIDNNQNRTKIRRIYETGWVNNKTTKKGLNDWGKLLGISGRTTMGKEQLLKQIRKKATDIRSYVRNQMD